MSTANPAGYSGKPLLQKLGFKPGFRVAVSGAPENYTALMAGAGGVDFDRQGAAAAYDAAHVFLTAAGSEQQAAAQAIAVLRPGGMLWLSWAKKSSRLHSGITEDSLRAAVLPLGWVDVKVCAVDADWSGLKFLRRRG
ncbi:hypothetical protein K3725_01775 [Leisingera sp. S132]|uniref:hypothetical protein n=1 Tax=Leisingera sp. S132 TaxID=2867016 RepID=UPI0021A3915E|nr:hypothetical protein [Leisingera sp. S132]UWQ79762.1 hypothetical protein K3725_01775 [Leisingera sp. S132]